jgi:hypothetical protein
MAGQKRGKFANNEQWPQLHWSISKTLSCTTDKEFEELVEAREQAWDRQIEADAEAGKLDQLAEEALRDYREGKCIRLP